MEVYTSSELSMFRECPYSWYWRFYQGLHKQTGLNQLIGQAVHLGLELRAKGKEWEREIDCLFSEETLSVSTMNGEIRKKQELSKILVNHFPLDDLEIIQTEVVFEAKIKNPETGWSLHHTRIAGKVDVLCRWKGHKGLWLLDYKTTSRIDDKLLKKLDMDLQGRIYVSYFPIETEGIIYALIEKPLIRQKKGETELEFLSRLDSHVVDKTTYVFEPFYREEDRIIQTQNELHLLIRHMKLMMKEKKFWHNDEACRSWRGCAYFDLCASGDMTPSDITRLKFRSFETKHPELLERKQRKELPF